MSQTTLKIEIEDQRMIARLAVMRGVSIAKLFAQDDIRAVFRNLLIAEMKMETERLTGINPFKE